MEFLYSIDFTELIKQSNYTGLIIFLIAFLETLLLVGFFFPGSMALVAIGSLISTGYLELWSTLFWAFSGAVVGDNISFWIGVYFQEPLRKSRIYTKYHQEFIKGENFFHQYGIYSVAIGRFIGPIRAVIPTIAGSLGMSGKLFFITNVVSALFWAPAYILSGVIIGEAFTLSYTEFEKFIHLELWSLLLVGMVTFGVFLWIKRSRFTKTHTKKSIAYLALFLAALVSLTVTQTTFQG
ncbi:MAG: DedA family protein [gamma proteobacterium symbiont of Bathyaustriella thionipta]|nr:DedA family protein [gamma proteobacterium symbiont of Bathyaustriella thionipta]MCU7950593.1 DedA family protein [gamma proteobacterium symbiont of Bathyaustriella thionipta]MCU7953532.1 DedA family protein [gamma proteobacterium symbiont of Bathyaustriella thionipta]MCU7957101.1 DedA family protein [gamma proteobacterium symbiont of Bathyaustriella thionipta]MCU7966575.1 DedA family protein [gamma proteobacterium symbiont of Bathyaustriella thionipta]